MRIYAPWEKQFKKIATPFEHFLHAQTTTGMVLMIMTVLALLLANSPLAESYAHFFHANIDLKVGSCDSPILYSYLFLYYILCSFSGGQYIFSVKISSTLLLLH